MAEEEPVLYGELVIVGTNGCLPSPRSNSPRRQSKISFYKRSVANGVTPGPVQRVNAPKDSSAYRRMDRHSVSYTLSRQETFVVEYLPDPDVDMFQIGRSSDSHIDFIVSEPTRCQPQKEAEVSLSKTNPQPPKGNKKTPPESAISRFACRIHIERSPPHTARIYAAGFNASNNIFLGQLAMKWTCHGQLDGLTTNGVMIHRCNEPTGNLAVNVSSSTSPSPDGNDAASLTLPGWREVSICGAVYETRNRRCVPTASNLVNEDNILVDKTLIDLCGIVLFWRSGTGLQDTVNTRDLMVMIDGLNKARLQCPILFRTLRLNDDLVLSKDKSQTLVAGSSATSGTDSKPYVYLSCGHVHGWHTWRADGDSASNERTCPLCLQPSRFVSLQMGVESAFYIDKALATHCFNPCGHMASEKTVRFWCSLHLPNGHSYTYQAYCPFCLSCVEPTPVRLRFHGDVDEEVMIDLLNRDLSMTS